MAGPGPQIDGALCERLVRAAAQSCPVQPAASAPPLPPNHEPNWDALANSFAALGVAFTWGTIVLAIVAILAAVGWGYVVRTWAEREARKEANECIKREMDKWLAEEAPQIIRKHVELLQNASLNPKADDGEAADEMGKEAG